LPNQEVAKMCRRGLGALAAVAGLLLLPSAALAGHGTEPTSKDMTHVANSPKPGTTNSDIAFWDELAFSGNYRGFRILDIGNPQRPKVLSDFKCNGGQSDMGVYGFGDRLLLFQSVDRRQTTSDCTSSDDPTRTLGWEGIRIFDVSDPRNPRFVKAVGTDCGSHTHTVVPDPNARNDRVFLYVSSYPLTEHGVHTHDDGGSADEGSECAPLHHKISVIEVPLTAPDTARVVSQPSVAPAIGCHDIGVFVETKKAAAACLTEGQMWDISDPANPKVTDHIYNPAVQIWHSGAFTWDGEVAIFGDEEGGAAATHGCGVAPPGAAWFYDVDSPQLPLGFFEQQRAQAPQGDLLCTTHNYNAIPVTDKYLLNSAYYEAGTGIVDFSAVKGRQPSAVPQPVGEEIAHFDVENGDGRGEANTWSSYWYKGYSYANDIKRGVDVFRYTGDAIRGARSLHHLNPQTQERLLTKSGG
jgi:hypothetical protein